MCKPQLASDRMQSALHKVKLAFDYLDMCEYHLDGKVGNLYAVILLLGEVTRELDEVACFVPDEPLRKVHHV